MLTVPGPRKNDAARHTQNEKERLRWLEEIDILDLVGMEAGKLDLQCECVRVAVTDLGKGIQPEQVVKAQPASGRASTSTSLCCRII